MSDEKVDIFTMFEKRRKGKAIKQASNNMIIKKKKDSKLKKASYYLTKENINNINKYSEQSNMKKSEFVNLVLSKVFEDLKIEE